jgi:enoyl-CoA hydratase/carnithine racemase
VLLKISGAKATLTLNRPRTGNSLDQDLQRLLTKHLDDLRANQDVRVVVLTGNGKYFCTGMNLGADGEGMLGNSEEQFERGSLLFCLLFGEY